MVAALEFAFATVPRMMCLLPIALISMLVQVSLQQSVNKDDRTDVSCSLNYMRIEIDRKFLNASKYSTINLLDSKCKARLSSSKIILDTLPHLCGSKRIETKDHIIYQNEVYMKAKPTGKLVTREHDVRVSFSCHYKKTAVLSQKSFDPQTIVDVKEDGFGIFKFHLKMYTDGKFTKEHSKYPIEATLSDTLFFEVNSTSNDDDLVILIDQCFATPSMLYKKDPTKYVFIEDRCPLESNVKFQKAGSKKQRFSMQAFSFIKEVTEVYVHCIVFMCRKSASDDQCARGCQGNNVNRFKRDLSSNKLMKSHSEYKLLDLGPLRRRRDSGSASQKFPFTIAGLVAGLAVVVALVAVAAVKIHKARNRRLAEHVVLEPKMQEKEGAVICEDENLL
ncbi:ZP domain-containing protein-like [Rhopilema esculentum]|uniref:ZP domain-containing protein-like n=1 Tax=Rhopilema esculentum TaxID=499914 RepID=UPI0031D26DBF